MVLALGWLYVVMEAILHSKCKLPIIVALVTAVAGAVVLEPVAV